MDGVNARIDSDSRPTQLSLDERKFAQEAASKERELALKEREVSAKEAELGRSRWLNPTVIGLFAATLGLVGNLIAAYLNNRNTEQVEHSRAQSSLIVQAVSTGDPQTACNNLISFIHLGLLDDPKGTMSRCLSAPGTIPVLPAAVRTYTPVEDIPGANRMAPIVTRVDEGDRYQFEVTFTVPQSPEPSYVFDLITVYAYQLDNEGIRSQDTTLSPVHGSWKPGNRVTFSADLPKKYVDEPGHTSYLRFCVGSSNSRLPSGNLLLPKPK